MEAHKTKSSKSLEKGADNKNSKKREVVGNSSNRLWRQISYSDHSSNANVQTEYQGHDSNAYEQQADVVSDRVSRILSGSSSATAQAQTVNVLPYCYSGTQRKGYGYAKSNVQKKESNSNNGSGNNPSLSTVIHSPAGGSRVNNRIQNATEQVTGADLSYARVHSDTASNNAAASINARAFTYGNHIFMGSGESTTDTKLMSHELTHVVQQTGAASEKKIVQRTPGVDEDLLPMMHRVTWGQDRFLVSFSRHDEDEFRISMNYQGPHQSSSIRHFDVNISSRILNCSLREAPGNEVVVDLYSDGAYIVRLQDEIRFLSLANGSGYRNHVMQLLLNGEFRQSSPFAVEDPAASSDDNQEYVTEFLPGTRPEFMGMSNPTTGKFELKADIDGDGDRYPELRALVEIDSFMSWGAAMRPLENLRLNLTKLSNNTRRYSDFTVSAPASRSVDPRDDLSDPPANALRLAFNVSRMADGRQPIIIDLTEPATNEQLRIFPPDLEDGEAVYSVDKGNRRVNYRFPDGVDPLRSVIQTGESDTLGRVKFWDTTLSRYGDRFRLLIDPGRSSQTTLFGVAPLGRNGQPYGGDGVPISFEGSINNISLLNNGPVSLEFDFNNDGQTDLFLHDRLESENGISPETERTHTISLTGPAVGNGVRRTMTFVSSALWSHRPTGESASANDTRINDAAMASYGLQQSLQSGGILARRRNFEKILSDQRKRAMDNGWITARVFNTWNQAEISMIRLETEMSERVSQSTSATAAANIRAFYNALVADAPRTMESTSMYSSKNPITGESRVRAPQISRDFQGHGADSAASLDAGNWSSGLRSYRRMRQGLDTWIMQQARANSTSSSELELMSAQQSMLSRLETLNDKGAKRIHAIFRPDPKFRSEQGYQAQFPLEMYYWREGDEWKLIDLTNPNRPFRDSVPAAATEFDSVRNLMSELNNEDHFCQGQIYFQVPNLITGQVPVQDLVTWRDFFNWLGIGLAVVGTVLSFGTGAVAVAGTWALVGAAVAGGTSAILNIIENERHGTTTATSIILDLAQIVASVAGVGALAAGRVLHVARASAAASNPLRGARWATLAATAQKYVIPLAATNLGADAVTLAVLTVQASTQLDAIENGRGTPEAKRDAKLRLLAQLAFTGGLTALSLRGNVAEIRMGRSIEIINVRGEPVVVPVGSSISGAAVMRSAASLDSAADDVARASAEQRLLQDMRSRIEGPGGRALADTEELAITTRSAGADPITIDSNGSLQQAGSRLGSLETIGERVARANNAARAHGLDFEYVLEVRVGTAGGTPEVHITRRPREAGGMMVDPRRMYMDVEARALAQTTELGRLQAAAGSTAHSIKIAPDGGIQVNNQIDIHPRAMAQINDADLQLLMSSTRALDQAGGDLTVLNTTNPTAAARIGKFESSSASPLKDPTTKAVIGPSRGYRLQFHVTHATTLAKLDELLALVGANRTTEAAFSGMTLAHLDRLRVILTGPVPSGTSNVKAQATRYALDQNPTNASDFVNHFEFYIADVNAQIRVETDALASTGVRVGSGRKRTIGRNVESSRVDASNPLVPTAATSRAVREAYDRIRAQINGRLGSRSIDPRLQGSARVDAIRALPDVRFSAESAATYHTHKHFHEMPAARQVTPEFDSYFRAAQDTIQNPSLAAEDVFIGAAQRGGGESFQFTMAEAPNNMTAYVFVTDEGSVSLATLIP